MATDEYKNNAYHGGTNGQSKRSCEWNECRKEGRYRIQTSAHKNDIHWFCQLHARLFDMSIVTDGPFFASPNPNWTAKQKDKNNPNDGQSGLNRGYRLRHVSKNYSMNYTREDIINLKTLGLETGAQQEDIKHAYKRLAKHCHPDQNPHLENATLLFTKITEAYMALKDRDFK